MTDVTSRVAADGASPCGSRSEIVARSTTLVVGGCLGSVVGVIGASVTDPEVGFPAWVDLTGVVAGFALGVLVAGLVVLVGHATRSWRSGR
jgi:hypothetical protein